MKRIGSLKSGVPCVYEIRNTATNQVYIGSTARFAIRFTEHRRMLEAGDHHARYLQNSYNKHGAIAFEMKVIEVLPHSEFMIPREQWWINKHGFRKTYNTSSVVVGGGRKAEPVFSICQTTGLVSRYESPQEAATHLFGTRDKAPQIHKSVRLMRKARGRYWTYDETMSLQSFMESKTKRKRDCTPCRVFAFNPKAECVASFRTLAEASDKYGVTGPAIRAALVSGFTRMSAGLLWSNSITPPTRDELSEFENKRRIAQCNRWSEWEFVKS